MRSLVAALVVVTAHGSSAARAQEPPWRWRIAPPAPFALERIAVRGPGQVLALARGRVHRLVGAGWRPATGRDATWREPVSSVPSDLPPGAPFTPIAAVRDQRGHVVALGARGELATWRNDRRQMEHRSGPSGATGMFIVPASPAWERFGPGTTGPREPVAIAVAGNDILVAGRDGALARMEWGELRESWAPLVAVPYPRVIAIVPAHDRSLLVITDRGVVRTSPAATRPIALPASAVVMLASVRTESASRFAAIPLGPDGALVAYRNAAFVVRGARAEPFAIAPAAAALGELWALQAIDTTHWVALTHIGRVVRGDAVRSDPAGSLTDVAGPAVPHPLGAFTGADMRVRLVDHGRTVACVGSSGPVVACGPPLTIEPRVVHPLGDGVVVETQSIRTVVVSTRGVREVARIPATERQVRFAGTADSPLSLAERRIFALRGSAWLPVASVPVGCEPDAFATTATAVFVGCAGGSVAELHYEAAPRN